MYTIEQMMYTIEQIFIDVNGQILKIIYTLGHTDFLYKFAQVLGRNG